MTFPIPPRFAGFWRSLLACLLAVWSVASGQTAWISSQRRGDEALFLFGNKVQHIDLTTQTWQSDYNLPRSGATAMVADGDNAFVAYGTGIYRYGANFTGETLVATATSSVHGLFLDGNLLIAVHSTGLYSRLTTYNRATSAQLSTKETYVDSLYGASQAPVANRIFGRTQGISPADIVYASYTDAGVLSNSADSPYHGDYAGGTKTWVFPDESRVVDSSGIAYSTTGLAYAGSFAGTITDIDFNVDVPIVLRGSEVIAFTPALLETGRAAAGTTTGAEVYVAGTNVLVFSPGTTNPLLNVVALSAINAPQPGTPVDPNGLAFAVDEAFPDKDGNLLLWSKAQMSIFRWSPTERRYTGSYPLLGLPSKVAYSKENHTVYLAYETAVVRKLDLAAATPVETPIFNLPSAPSGFATAGSFIYAAAGGNIMTFTPAGAQLTNSGFTYYSGAHNVWEPVKRRVYHFRDGISPNDLHYDTLALDGTITGGGETPYHGDFVATAPIRPNADGSQLVLGSGVVFETTGMTKKTNLANGLTDAVWVGDKLVTIRLINGLTQLQTWEGAQLLQGSVVRQFNGTPLRIFSSTAGLVVMTLHENTPRYILLNEALETLYISPTKPATPGNPLVSARDDDSITLQWQDLSDNEDGFHIEYHIGSGEWQSGATVAANATSGTVSGLAQGTVHEFRVIATNAGLVSAPSAVVSGRTTNGPDEPVGEPYSLRITRIFNNRITLEWQDNANNETGFRVLRSTTATGATTTLMAPANAVSFTDTSLAANTTYYYRVQAVNGSIEGDLSAQVNGKTLSSSGAPTSPSSLVATAPAPTTVTLTWNDNSTNEDEFIVERSLNPVTTWTELGRPGFNVKTFTDATAAADTAYSYRVRASNSSGVSSNSTTTIKTPKLGGDFAGYDIRSGNIHYFAFTGPHRIERYDLVARAWLSPVPLNAAATALWVDPAGIFVAEDRAVVRFALDGSGRTPMANAETTVKGLFVLGDVLAFQNGESLTTLNKSTGIVIATTSSYYVYGGSGFSIAPSMSRAFYRSTGISPSDIRYVELGADGKVAKTAESPYHGDYPSATRTFVFPNGARVADNSGTVYSTDSLSYNNSLGGAFTDLAFYGADVPIILRNDKLVSYTNTMLEVGSFSLGSVGLRVGVDGSDAIVFSVDGQSQRGLSVRVVPLSRLAAPVPGAAVDPRGLAYTPDEVFLDKDGNVLLFNKAQLSLFRWSPAQTTYLPTVPLLGAPSHAAYSAQNHAAYFAYASQVVRKLDLSAATPVETPLFNLPSAPNGLATAGEYIFSSDYSGAWGTHYVYSNAGAPIHSLDWNYYSRVWTWDPVLRRMYFFRDSQSPNDLHYETLGLDGKITGEGETPYHGDFTATPPIRVKPDGSQIVIGSGVVFKASDMTKLTSLANNFTDAAWHGGRLVTVRLINGVSQLQTWTEPQYTIGADVRQVSGTPVRLIPLDAGRLLLITLIDGVPRFTIFNTSLEPTYVSPSKPLAPSGLLVTARSTTGVSLAWTDGSDNEDGFRLEYRSGTGAWLNGGSVGANVTAGTVTGLDPGATYEFRVLASNTDLLSAPSPSATATTLSHPDQPIGEPYGLRITRIFNDRITLEWQDNASNETGFNLLRSSTPTGAALTHSAPAGATSYTITGLSAATTYYFRVQAVNGTLLGDLSAQVSGTTLSTNSAPTAPSTLAVASKSANSVSLTWKDNSTNEESFAVERSTSPATTWSTVGTLPFNSVAYTDTTVSANTAYTYRVRAANAAGSTVSSTLSVTTPKLGGDFAGHSIRSGDVYYFSFTGPNRIERYDIANRTWLGPVALEAAPTALWVDEAGIYVAEDRAVSRFALDGSNRTPMGNSQSTVGTVYTLNDVLVFGPSGGEQTSLNKKTGLFLSTFSTNYGGGGHSTAPGLNRVFYRTTGVSPSDIGYLEVGTDGKLVKTQESPYHGDYASGTRTFVFPDGARVVDDSGTVYSTASLSYTNSLGGSFTDLAFRGQDVPIVLRTNKLHAYSNTLLEAGSYTLPGAGLRVAVADSDALVFSADGTQARGLKVQAVPLSLLSAPQPGNAIDPRGLAFTPDDMFVDKDGNLLFFSKAHLSLFRWSQQQRQFLPTVPLLGVPSYAAYSKENHSAYFAYETQVIRALDLAAATPKEQSLFNLPQPPRGLATAGQFIFSTDASGAWDSHYVHTPAGTMVDSEEWNYYSRVWTWDPVKRRMYFFRDDTSPNDLHWESLAADGTINGEGETPYHGDFNIAPPIRVSPDGSKVVIGAGPLFETTGMTRLTTLASTFVDAAWRSNTELLTIAASGTQTKLQRWTGGSFTAGTSTLYIGAPHRIFRLDNGGFVLITLDRGMPRIYLLDQNLATTYQYAPDVPRVSGTPPLASEDEPFSWKPDLWQFAGSGQLTLQPVTLPAWLTLTNGVLSGTPGEADSGDVVNRSKIHRIVLRIRDGLNNSEDREFFVTVNWQNDAPVLPAPLPAVQANDAGDPTVSDFKPLLVDPDGLDTHHWEITGNTNPAIFAQTAIDDNGVLSLSYAPYMQGSSVLTLKATDASGASTSATVQVTLPDLPPPLVTAGTELVFSRLTGLYEQTVTVTNVAQRAIAGFQLSLSGLRTGVTLYNGVNGEPGNASILYQQPLAAGASVTMVLEYWASPRGDVPPPVISSAVTVPSAGAPAALAVAPQPFAINRCEKFSDGCVVVEFNAVPGKSYRVEYSSDARNWKSCPVPMRAGGTKLQWIDRGPPWTECAPSAAAQRFYRVISLDN